MQANDFITRFHTARSVTALPVMPNRQATREAAVLVPVIKRDSLTLLFTRRALHLNKHPGQVSFPGGKKEPTDSSLRVTALRETQEEIGIPADKVQILGSLPQTTTVSGFRVTPYVGLITPPFQLITDANEVDRVFEVPLSFLLSTQHRYTHWHQVNDQRYPVHFYAWQEDIIWGATAGFIHSLRQLLI